MLLTVDIGNTNIVWGLFDGPNLKGPWRLVTDASLTAKDYGTLLTTQCQMADVPPEQITGAICCSVVPLLTPVFEKAIRSAFRKRLLIADTAMDSGLTLRYTTPQSLGSDRLANAAGAYERYKTALIIVDLGTATTFCAVTDSGEYLGGAIAPGLGISAEALFARTAQLPRVELVRPESAIGRDTASSIRSGLILGHAGLVDSLVTRMQQELGQEALVIATGGLAPLVAPDSRTIHKVRPNLTLEGLETLYRLSRKTRSGPDDSSS